MLGLKGKYAVVTGAAQGIGKAIAERLYAEELAGIAVLDMNDEKLKETCAEIDKTGKTVVPFKCNVADRAATDKVFADIYAKFGRIDILVNNAGIIRDAMFHKMTDAQWDLVIDVNVGGIYNCTKNVINQMREQEFGRIINISSTSAYGNVGQCNYSMTKAGIIGFTKTLAKESGRKGITVNSIAPGFIETEMMLSIPPEQYERAKKGSVMQRAGQPSEIAALVAYLASTDASYVNGVNIDCCGGNRT